MLSDETCWFLAADFDKNSWMQDVAAFRDTARAKGVPIAIERSRSGQPMASLEMVTVLNLVSVDAPDVRPTVIGPGGSQSRAATSDLEPTGRWPWHAS